MTIPVYPPGPKFLLPQGFLVALYRDTLGFMQKLAREHGDIIHTKVGNQHWVMVNHPDYIKDVLVTHHRKFTKSTANAKEWDMFLGKGLLNSEGDLHLHQRRVMEHAFRNSRINEYGKVMVEYAARIGESWQDAAHVDMHHEMMRLALSIAGKTLFDVDVGSALIEEVDKSLAAVVRFASMHRLPFAPLLEKLPLPIVKHFYEANDHLNSVIYRLIEEHRARGQDRGDLLSMLLTPDSHGHVMSDKQVRDEALTMLMAGHETTANALSFTWYLLSQHPAAEAKFHAEIDAVLAGRLPTVADLPRLPYTEQVFRESLRLYPAGWVISRMNVEEVKIGAYTFAPETIFVLSEYVIHRDSRFFAEPERFWPERWTPEFRAELPRYAYIPFGGGPRQCIGEHFAWMEGPLVMATLGQRWHARLVPGFQVVPDPVIMLRPRDGIAMTLERRARKGEPPPDHAGYPPGPKHLLPGQILFSFYRDALGLFLRMAREYGDMVHVQLGAQHAVLLSHPDLVREVLVTRQKDFIKIKSNEKEWDAFVGQGLLTSDGDFHMRQRRLMEHAFHGDRIRGYGTVMAGYAAELRNRWQEGAKLDVAREMMELTLSVVGKTLFDIDVGSTDVDTISRSLAAAIHFAHLLRLPFARLLERLPLPVTRRFHEGQKNMDALIYRLIHEHRTSGKDHGDLLSMLLLARDDQGTGGMTDKQVRDEAMTMLIAGHETTANALSWTWYLLSQNPEAEAKLHAEVDTVLAGRLQTVDDLPRLTYTEKVFREALRLYPPGWVSSRQALHECKVGGYTFPPDTLLIMSQYVMHRDLRYYAKPERFDPDRWTPEFRATLPRFAYFPFGGGPRQCIGEHFAWMEAGLMISTLAQRWRLRLVPGRTVVPQPVIMLRIKNGLPMILERR